MSSPSRPWRAFFASLAHALSWKRWLWTAALSAFSMTWVFRTFFELNVSRAAGILPWLLALGGIALVCVALAEASVPQGRIPSTVRYVGAIVVAAVIAAAVFAGFHEPIRVALRAGPAGGVASPAPASRPHVAPIGLALFGATNVLILGLVVVLAHARLQHVRRASRALSEAEIAREEAQRRLAAWHLEAVHGQVDPAAVIARLEEIERAYEGDAVKADAMLEELIEKLRAAIPRLRTQRISGAVR
jgi:hypothetical protein